MSDLTLHALQNKTNCCNCLNKSKMVKSDKNLFVHIALNYSNFEYLAGNICLHFHSYCWPISVSVPHFTGVSVHIFVCFQPIASYDMTSMV